MNTGLYTNTFLGIPFLFWIIMICSHAVYLFFKINNDVLKNKIAANVYFKNYWNIAALVVSFIQCFTLLLVGWDAYSRYLLANPVNTYSWLIAIMAAFIGYGGVSLWNAVMKAMDKKARAAIDAEPSTDKNG